jgi:predicted TIM-barrel fold metal-dependent hydrolase
MYKGPIIDAHMHLWDRANPGYEWLANTTPLFGGGQLNRDFLLDDYFELIKGENITAAVHIQCGGFPADPVQETEWLQNIADLTGWPQAIIAHANLTDHDFAKQLERHCLNKNMRGIRMMLNYADGQICFADRGDYMQNPLWQKNYALLARHHLLYEMQAYDVQLDDVYEIASTYEHVPMVLSHLGWPTDFSPEGFKIWEKNIKKVAQLEHVSFKLSCIGTLFMNKDEADIYPYIHAGIAAFGPERCMFGSNCPPDDVHIKFKDIYRIFKKAASEYTPAEQHALFFDTAKRVYDIDTTTSE